MGQKVNPYGIRLGINKTWSSRWFSKNEYTKLLHQDLKIKSYVEKKLKNAINSEASLELDIPESQIIHSLLHDNKVTS